jgi:6,7-dimethyl-8-ribityllumazine synthase
MNNSVNVYDGQLTATGLKIGIVGSRFNDFFVSKLVDGAIDTIVRHGGEAANIDVVWVPGSYEIPLAIQKLADSGRYDALIALGVVIQGATAHADYINSEVAKGLAQVSMKSGIPVAYGVVTTENIEQAIERAGSKAGNRGASAAMTAIEMANLVRILPKAAVAKAAVVAVAPQKRGRPAKTAVAVVAAAPAAAPQKRGRPAKKAPVVEAAAAPKKRGRPSKKELRARKKAEKIATSASADAATLAAKNIVAKVVSAVEAGKVVKVAKAAKAAKTTKSPKVTKKAPKAPKVEKVSAPAAVSVPVPENA